MPNLKLFCEPKPDYYFFQNEIISRVQKGDNDWLAVFPVNRAVRSFTRKLVDNAPNKIIINAPVFTFDNLLLNIYQRQPSAKTVITYELLTFLVEEILKKLALQFSFLPKDKTPPARLVRKISKMITELRRFGYSATELTSKNIEDAGIEKNKLDDFILIIKTLEEILGDRYIDIPAAHHEAAVQLNQQILENIFSEIKNIFISGYGLFTPAMFHFVEKVKSFCNVYIKLEFNRENPALFENTKPAYERFSAMGAEIIQSEKTNPFAQKLFNRDLKNTAFDARETISSVYCDNVSQEIITIARYIHKLKNEENLSLDKIAVTFNPLENYVPSIHRIFTEYNIPFNLSTGYSLKQSPLIAAMINILDLANENLEYTRVFNLYQSPFFQSGYNYLSIYLYKSIIKGRIKYLAQDWDNKLLHNLRLKGERISDNLKNQAENLKSFLKPFYTFGTHNRPVAQFKEDYLKLLRATRLPEWYKSDNPGMSERQREREFRAFNKFMKILDQFSWSMQVVFAEQETDLKTWLQHLKSAIARSVYNLTEWPVEAVQIMPRLEIQAISFDVLFIGGLVDGQFPRSSAADIFLTDENRQKMGLLASEDLLFQDRFIFFSLLNSARKKVFLTVPRYAGEKALVPSSFIDDLKECCIINEPSEEENKVMSLPNAWESFGLALQSRDLILAKSIKSVLYDSASESFNQLLYKIKAQHQRLSLFEKPAIFEGNLSQKSAVAKLANQNYRDQVWSITRLEDYAFCPMQYFLKRILNLEEMPVFDEEVSPLERGSAVHNILFKFYSKLREQNALTVPGGHLELLNKIAGEELDHLPFDGFFWELEKIRYFGRGDSPGLLKTFLETETKEIAETGFIPAHFEFCFGPAYDRDVDPQSVPQLLTLQDNDGNRIQINGKIDRIDIDPKTKMALVYDYKTGSIDGKNAQSVAKGLSFQLPVYILAVEQLLDTDLDVVYGGYYQVKDAQNCGREAALADPDKYPYLKKASRARLPNNYVKVDDKPVTFDELIDFSKTIALAKQQELMQGIFTHTKYPDDKRCSGFCDYKRMCQKYVAKIKYQNK